MRKLCMSMLLVLVPVASAAPPPPTPGDGEYRAPEPEVYIIEPRDGATVSNPVRVVFGLRHMGVAPAGVNHLNTGHHHLVIDQELPRLDQPIAAGYRNVRHFNGGQTETQIILLPGTHTLQLLIGDYAHMPHIPAIASEKITVTVKP